MPGTKSSEKATAKVLPGRQYACDRAKSFGVVPSRHVVTAHASGHCVPGYYRYAL